MKTKQEKILRSTYKPIRITDLSSQVKSVGIATFKDKYSNINVANIDNG